MNLKRVGRLKNFHMFMLAGNGDRSAVRLQATKVRCVLKDAGACLKVAAFSCASGS